MIQKFWLQRDSLQYHHIIIHVTRVEIMTWLYIPYPIGKKKYLFSIYPLYKKDCSSILHSFNMNILTWLFSVSACSNSACLFVHVFQMEFSCFYFCYILCTVTDVSSLERACLFLYFARGSLIYLGSLLIQTTWDKAYTWSADIVG